MNKEKIELCNHCDLLSAYQFWGSNKFLVHSCNGFWKVVRASWAALEGLLGRLGRLLKARGGVLGAS